LNNSAIRFVMSYKSTVRYCFATFIVLYFLIDPTYGQRWKLRRYEVGGGIGITQVFGDIGGTLDKENWLGLKDIKVDETRLAFAVLGRYKIDPVYSIKLNAILGFGNGTDADSRNDRGREYKTTLFEFSGQLEYYLIGEEKRYRSAAMFNRRGMLNNYASFSAYGFLGFGLVYSHANVIYTTYDPHEGDKVKKSNIGPVMPIGLGLKYIIDDRWLVNTELGYRISFTDYIEGFSQTQFSKHKDVYYFLTISASYRLESSRRGLPALFDRGYRKVKPVNMDKTKKPKSAKEAKEAN
jgi:hypothetical protein